MTDHASHFGVHQFGGGSGTLLGIGRIVFGQQFKLGGRTTNGQTGGIQLLDGHLRAVFIVLAKVGNGATGGTDVTNLDDLSVSRRSRSRRLDRCCSLFFFAASGQGDGRSDDGQFDVQLHRYPRKGMKVEMRRELFSPHP